MRRKRHVLGVTMVVLAVTLVAGAGERRNHAGREHHPATAAAGADTAQTACPVMVGNKIDPNIYSVYKGKRVYFCCLSCKDSFDAAPEKYLHRLPQFAEAEPEAEHEHAQEHGVAWSRLIKPLGIATLTLLLLTAAAGLFRRKNPRVLLKCHKALALTTVVVALCHATLVFLLH